MELFKSYRSEDEVEPNVQFGCGNELECVAKALQEACDHYALPHGAKKQED